jgi:hypothetical protein
VDNFTQQVHVLTPYGRKDAIPFDRIIDIQKCESTIYVSVSERVWILHGCDPAWLNKPVPAIAVGIFSGHIVSGVVVPKWPGARPGQWLHLKASEVTLTADHKSIISRLLSVGFNPRRVGTPSAERDRIMHTAKGRISKFLTKSLNKAGRVPLPHDPSA